MHCYKVGLSVGTNIAYLILRPATKQLFISCNNFSNLFPQGSEVAKSGRCRDETRQLKQAGNNVSTG